MSRMEIFLMLSGCLKRVVVLGLAVCVLWGATIAGFAQDSQRDIAEYMTVKALVDEYVGRKQYKPAAVALEDFVKKIDGASKLKSTAYFELGNVYMRIRDYYKARDNYKLALDGGQVAASENSVITKRLDLARKRILRVELASLTQDLENYYEKHVRYPSSLAEIVPSSRTLDPWGNKYVYFSEGFALLPDVNFQNYVLYSGGPNGHLQLGRLDTEKLVDSLKVSSQDDTSKRFDVAFGYRVADIISRDGTLSARIVSTGHLQESHQVKAGQILPDNVMVEDIFTEGVVLSKNGQYGAILFTEQ